MRTGRPIPPITVTDEQRSTLENWARRPKTAQALALGARTCSSRPDLRPHHIDPQA
jgi:hypothetical protein